jgi:2-amino-4-hydroxy-6-hydroxymethyldihydropteridine diphosphokinase
MKTTMPSSLDESANMPLGSTTSYPHGASRQATEIPTTVVGLGSNVGDRRAMIEAATEAICALSGVELVGRSSIWQTAPMGTNGPQRDYFNAAVGVKTTMPPESLLRELLAIETRLGRTRLERNAPRTIDLDILWRQGPEVHKNEAGWPTLDVPHPRLTERAFAMIPLLEIVPDATEPRTGRLYAEILAEVGTQGVDPAPF